MAAYATWDYYKQEFKGTTIEDVETFDQYVLRAGEHLDSVTMGRAQAYFTENPNSEPLKKAACAIAEVLHRMSLLSVSGGGGGDAHGAIVAEKNDHFSVTYSDLKSLNPDSISGAQALQAKVYQIARQYLQWTGLLYAGVGVAYADKC